MMHFKFDMKSFLGEFAKERDRVIKASQAAGKVELFRLKNLLHKEIRAGAPGGKKLPDMTEIGRGTRNLKQRNKSPLWGLAAVVRYNTTIADGRMKMELGFVDTRREKISSSWKRIAMAQQTGATISVTDAMRKRFRGFGVSLQGRKGKAKGRAKYYFLRKETTTFNIPARDIIDTFIAAHQAEALANIQSNFERKMRGERI